MQMNKPLARVLPPIGYGVLSFLLFFSTGCEPYNVSSLAETDYDIAVQQAADQQASADPNDVAPPPDPDAPVVAPPPVVQSGFVWEPRGDSIRIVIPASLAHWQFLVVTRKHHETLYGPDNRAGNRDVDVEYILPGGPGVWAARASSLDSSSGGQMLVYVNTRDGQATGHNSAGWRIIDPYQAYYGDEGIRLQPGENK